MNAMKMVLASLVLAAAGIANAQPGGPISRIEIGKGFGCAAPKQWLMVNNVATCGLPVVSAPPAPPPTAVVGLGGMNGKTFRIRVVAGYGQTFEEIYTLTGSPSAITVTNNFGAPSCTFTGPGQCLYGADPDVLCAGFAASQASTKLRLNPSGTVDAVSFWAAEIGGDAGQVYSGRKSVTLYGAILPSGTTLSLTNTGDTGDCRYVVPSTGGGSDGG